MERGTDGGIENDTVENRERGGENEMEWVREKGEAMEREPEEVEERKKGGPKREERGGEKKENGVQGAVVTWL